VWIKSGSVAAGYWNRTEETRAAFSNRLAGTNEGPFLATGDLGFVETVSYTYRRTKDVIIIRGRNLYPQDIEMAVSAEVKFIDLTAVQRFLSTRAALSKSRLSQKRIASW